MGYIGGMLMVHWEYVRGTWPGWGTLEVCWGQADIKCVNTRRSEAEPYMRTKFGKSKTIFWNHEANCKVIRVSSV